jgi:hypothetical protein
MPIKINFGRDTRTDAATLLVQFAPEPVDVLRMLRDLKRYYVKEWAQVNCEIIAPDKPKLVLQGDLPGTNGHPDSER